MMNEKVIRKDIVRICHRLYEKEFITAYDGNVSARVGADRIITTPSGICKGYITEDDLIVINSKGKKTAGLLKPSSENRLHAMAYELRDDIGAVIHAHAPMAIAFSVAGVSLIEAILPEIVFTLGSIPTAPYATPTTEEVPESIRDLIKIHDAIILAKHGTLTVGKNVEEAYFRLEKVEHAAKVIYYARNLGNVFPLNEEQIEKLFKVSDKFGIKRPVVLG
jgi:L-fuculose-phosphate aldolase